MSQIVIVKEFAKKDRDNLGLEKLGKSRFHGSNTALVVPKVNGTYKVPEMDKTQKSKIETGLNIKFGTETANEFLSNFLLEINTDLMAWDLDNPLDLLKYLYASQVFKTEFAANPEEASDPLMNQKFLIVRDQEETKTLTSQKQTRNKALSRLEQLFEKDSERLIKIAKYLLPSNLGLGLNKHTAYNALDEFINGNMPNYRNPERLFLDALEEKAELIDITSIVKEALIKQVIRRDTKGQFINVIDQVFLGTSEASVVEFLMRPENGDILGYGLDSDSPNSIRYQIKIKN